jgi:hypothetical protein
LNRSKRSLRSTLQALTAALTDAILAAARESLFELADSRPAAPPRTRRAPRRAKAARVRTVAAVEHVAPQAFEGASDQVITDPQALLAALDTAAPPGSPERAHESLLVEHHVPDVLLPVEAPAPELVFVPALRAGEEIMRRSFGSSVVLRRRRM